MNHSLTALPKQKNNNPLWLNFQEIVSQDCLEETVPDGISSKKIIFLSIRGITTALGLLSGVSFIAVSDVSTENQVLRAVLSVSTLVSYAIWSIWVWNICIDDLDNSELYQENLDARSPLRKVLFPLLGLLCGAGSSMPTSYLAYVYNPQKFWVVFNYVQSTGLQGLIFAKLFDDAFAFLYPQFYKCASNENSRDAEKTRDELYHVLTSSKKSLCAQQRVFDQLVESLMAMNHMSQLLQEERTFAFIEELVSQINFNGERGVFCSLRSPISSRLTWGALIPLPAGLINGFLSYQAASLLTNNMVAKITLTALGFFLNYYTSAQVAEEGFETVQEIRYKQYKKKLSETVNAKLYKSLLVALVVIGSTSVIASAPALIEEMQKKFPQYCALGFVLLATFSGVSVNLLMSVDIIDTFFGFYYRRFGDVEVKKLSKVCHQIEILARKIHQCTPEDLVEFLRIVFRHEGISSVIQRKKELVALNQFRLIWSSAVEEVSIVSENDSFLIEGKKKHYLWGKRK